MSGGESWVSSSSSQRAEAIAAGQSGIQGATCPVRTSDPLPSISSPCSLSTIRSSMDNHIHPGLPLRAPGAGSRFPERRVGGMCVCLRAWESLRNPIRTHLTTPHLPFPPSSSLCALPAHKPGRSQVSLPGPGTSSKGLFEMVWMCGASVCGSHCLTRHHSQPHACGRKQK